MNLVRILVLVLALAQLSFACGTERWLIKSLADPEQNQISAQVTDTTIERLRGELPPANLHVIPDYRHRPVEITKYRVHALLLGYKQETDQDFHLVIASPSDRTMTMIAEIPAGKCVPGPLSRQESALQLWVTKTFGHTVARGRMLKLHPPRRVIVEGVGFFDFIHGQTGVAPNGIEIHPILDIKFTTPTTTSIGTNLTPSQYAQSVTFNLAVTNGGTAATATGSVGVFDGGIQIGTATLDPSGQSTYITDSLAVGSHNITARYFGDGVNAPSSSTVLVQVVNKADQAITFAALADKT